MKKTHEQSPDCFEVEWPEKLAISLKNVPYRPYLSKAQNNALWEHQHPDGTRKVEEKSFNYSGYGILFYPDTARESWTDVFKKAHAYQDDLPLGVALGPAQRKEILELIRQDRRLVEDLVGRNCNPGSHSLAPADGHDYQQRFQGFDNDMIRGAGSVPMDDEVNWEADAFDKEDNLVGEDAEEGARREGGPEEDPDRENGATDLVPQLSRPGTPSPLAIPSGSGPSSTALTTATTTTNNGGFSSPGAPLKRRRVDADGEELEETDSRISDLNLICDLCEAYFRRGQSPVEILERNDDLLERVRMLYKRIIVERLGQEGQDNREQDGP
ncbi:hypothetical protein QBC47DRAFT_395674 [Echria macrotheca]|uniref:Uncharacterized protein n=1 Tax=Echria macrotheca TaxID=438768 RepID=A0AAJ0EZW3_9PEZI|nr:hypothetical protein QBC47DRAFT_395674 [Echria macrotheca]